MADDAGGAPALGRRGAARVDAALVTATSVMALIGMFALVGAIVVVVGDIVWRRIGGGSFIGAVDLTQFSVMAAASWSIPYAFATGAHVTVDLLNHVFPRGLRRALDITAHLIGAGVSGFLCWLSFGRAQEIAAFGDASQDLAIPMVWFWGFLVTGLGASTIVCAVRAITAGASREG